MELKQHRFDIADQVFRLYLPADEQASLDAAIAGNGVDPYWGKLWDAAVDSARCVLLTDWPQSSTALELGCGVGLTGIAGLMAGLEVTFSDHDPAAVELAQRNARENGFPNSRGLVLDWQQQCDLEFDFILASDVLYDRQAHLQLLHLSASVLQPGGGLYVADPGRQLARDFLKTANHSGWSVQIFDRNLEPCLAPFNNQFQWLVLKRSTA